MIAETGTYNIYFRLYPTRYFLGKNKCSKRFFIMKRIFDEMWGMYRWKIVKRIGKIKNV